MIFVRCRLASGIPSARRLYDSRDSKRRGRGEGARARVGGFYTSGHSLAGSAVGRRGASHGLRCDLDDLHLYCAGFVEGGLHSDQPHP